MTKVNRGPAYAKALLAELKVSGSPDARSIAAQLQLDVTELDVQGFDGGLVRAKGTPFGAIIVRDSIREPGRKSFTVAHEIGHFVLPGHDAGGADVVRLTLATGRMRRESLSVRLTSLQLNCCFQPTTRNPSSEVNRRRST